MSEQKNDVPEQKNDVSEQRKVTVSKANLLVAAIATMALIVTTGIAFFVMSKDDEALAATVTAEPANTSTNPFMPPVGTDQANVTPPLPAAGPPAAAAAAPPAMRYPGNTEGLYGGTLNYRTCDAKKMIDFFAVNPDKAAAWAGVLGIGVSEIATFLQTLTPVVLRSDTYVLNHGWEGGRATSFVSVLQAGTAVFVNKYGFPVVKCYCGNPLTPWYPPVSFKPRWRCGCPHPEPYWPHWGKTTIVIIERTTVIIDKFTLVDTTTGKPFVRPAGPATTDAAYVPPSASPTPPATTASPPPPPSVPPLLPTQQDPPPPPPVTEPPPPQVTGTTALRLLRSRVQECEEQGVRYPWEQAVSQKDSFYQIGTVLRWIVTIQDTTATGSTKDFSFEVDPVAGTVEPSNSWARRAAEHCAGLSR